MEAGAVPGMVPVLLLEVAPDGCVFGANRPAREARPDLAGDSGDRPHVWEVLSLDEPGVAAAELWPLPDFLAKGAVRVRFQTGNGVERRLAARFWPTGPGPERTTIFMGFDLASAEKLPDAPGRPEGSPEGILAGADIPVFRTDDAGVLLDGNRSFARLMLRASPEGDSVRDLTGLGTRSPSRPVGERPRGGKVDTSEPSFSADRLALRSVTLLDTHDRRRRYQVVSLPVPDAWCSLGSRLGFVVGSGQSDLPDAGPGYLAAAVEQMAEAVVLTDRNGDILWVNPAFERITGYSRAEALGRNPRLLKSGRHDRAFYAALWEEILAGRVWTGRMYNLRKDGREYQEEMTITPLRDGASSITGFVAVKRDVTVEVELESRLEEIRRQHAVARLAGGIAHELNTPIQYVSDNLGFLSDATGRLLDASLRCEAITRGPNPARPEEIAGFVRRELEDAGLDFLREEIPAALFQIREGLQQASGIVGAMLEFTRNESTADEEVPLHPLVERVLALVRPLPGARHTVVHERGGGNPSVRGHAGSLGMAIYQMVLNAVEAVRRKEDRDAGAPPGRVTVRTGQSGGEVFVEVEDNGAGATDEVRARMFEPFFTTRPPGEGKGLGLAIAWSIIVDRHGGRIEVGDGPDGGLKVRASLPARSR